MAKKKKPTLKPVARVFATTSQPKKAEPEPEEEVVQEDPTAPVEGGATQPGALGAEGGAPAPGQDDWEKEVNVDQERLQGYVERLQEKGDKEVNRIVKAIDFDRRMTKGLVSVDLTAELRDEALAIRLEQEEGVRASPARKPDDTTQAAKEKALLRLYITHHVLLKLGYTLERVMQCLHALSGRLAVVGSEDKVTQGWEEALEWMWLHEEDYKTATD